VIASNTSSLPEVAGDAALLVDPYDARALAEAMRRLTVDAALRAQLSRRGIERAAEYSWSRTARETALVYRSAAEDHAQKRKG
jgi:glycosyltransferase involved in cell wall biosynthesis